MSVVFVASFGFANLSIGAQIPNVPASRYALAVSTVIAVAAIGATWRSQRELAS
jgi:hypothetical protein